MEIGIVSEFNYLGVLLSKSGNLSFRKIENKNKISSLPV
jgi:hypothetical protein